MVDDEVSELELLVGTFLLLSHEKAVPQLEVVWWGPLRPGC